MKLANGIVVIDDDTGIFLDQSDNDACDIDGRKLLKSTGATFVDWELGSVDTSVESTTSYISPPTLTAHTDNWEPIGISTCRIVLVSSTANIEIRGLLPIPGRVLTLINIDSNDKKLKNESLTSIASYRFRVRSDITFQGDESVTIWYDPTISRWRAIAGKL